MKRGPEKLLYNRLYYQRNQEKLKAYARQYRKRNREKIKVRRFGSIVAEQRLAWRENIQKWRGRNREKLKDYRRQWRLRNRDKERQRDRNRTNIQERKEQNRLWRARNPEKFRKNMRNWRNNKVEYRYYFKYGIDITDYPKPQSCPICHEPRNLVFDHHHDTGKARGWICRQCNMMIGLAKENPARLRAAADYIERHAALPAPDAESVNVTDVEAEQD